MTTFQSTLKFSARIFIAAHIGRGLQSSAFYWRIVFNLVPLVIAGVIVANATIHFMSGRLQAGVISSAAGFVT